MQEAAHIMHMNSLALNQNQPMGRVICMQKCLLVQCLSDKLFCNKEVDKGEGGEVTKRINANLEPKAERL